MMNSAVHLLLALLPVIPTARTPFPAWQGPNNRLLVPPGTNAAGLKDALAGSQFTSDAQFIVVMVDVADRAGTGSPDAPGDPALEYGDELYNQWVRDGALNRGLDGARHVLVTHALSNRAVAIHWGSEWEKLGFKSERGGQVIDRSDFVVHARAGMFADANLALIKQIDKELLDAKAHLEREEKARLERAQQQAREQARREARFRESYPETVKDLRAKVEFLRAHPGFHGEADSHLQSLEQHLYASHDTLNNGSWSDAQRNVELAQKEWEIAKLLAERKATRDVFMRRTLPSVAGGGALLLALLVLLGLRKKRQENMGALRQSLDTWDQRLTQAATRMMELEERHAIFFRASSELASRLTGESLSRFRQVGEVVDGLVLRLDVMRELVDQVDDESKAVGALAYKHAEILLTRLEGGNLEISSESRPDKMKLFLPAPRVEKIPKQQLTGELDAHYARAVELLEHLHQDWREAPVALQSLAKILDDIAQAAKRILGLGLPLDPYQAQRDALRIQRDQAAAILANDFVGARKQAVSSCQEGEALCKRMEEIARQADTALNRLPTETAALEKRVGELRATGIAVREPVFQPDNVVLDIRSHLAAALAALTKGDLEGGTEHVDQAQHHAANLKDHVDETLRSREESPAILAQHRKRSSQLSLRSVESGKTLAGLAASYALSSFAHEADNLEECAPLFRQIDEKCRDVDAHLAAQCYLEAADVLTRVGNALSAITGLLDEIDKKRSAIEAAMAHTRDLVTQLEKTHAGESGFLDANAHAISAAADAAYRRVDDVLKELRREMDGAKPDWFVLERSAGNLHTELEELLGHARADVAAHQAATSAVDKAGTEVARVRALLESSSVDRAPANAKLASALAELEQARHELNVARNDWTVVCSGAEDAALLAQAAADLAARDVKAERAARNALGTAEQTIRSADCYYGHGVHADVGPAKARQESARVRLLAQDYEGALDDAQHAVSLARRAAENARARVRRMEEEERERERRAAAARAASSSSMRHSLSSSSSSSRSFSSSSSSSRSYSGSSSSSRRY